jgi:OmpA-OmpF porin, OOP family
VDYKSNPKNFWNNHVRSFAMLVSFYLLSLTPSFGQHTCNLGELPSIRFRSRGDSLVGPAKAILDSVGNKLKDNPFCSITIVCSPFGSKAGIHFCKNRLTVIKTYLMEKAGISADRIDIRDDPLGGVAANTVDLKAK